MGLNMYNKLSGLIKTVKQQEQSIRARDKRINIMQNNLAKLQKIVQLKHKQNFNQNMHSLYPYIPHFWISNQVPGVRYTNAIKNINQSEDYMC